MLEVNIKVVNDLSTSWRSPSSDQEIFKTLGVCMREGGAVVSYVRNSCNTFFVFCTDLHLMIHRQTDGGMITGKRGVGGGAVREPEGWTVPQL